MTRPDYEKGGFYHIYNRGRSRLSIFHQSQDYLEVLALMWEYGRKFSLQILAYCLLPNHYHFLVRQDDTPRASLLPQRIFNSYSKKYNLRYQHSGTIFQGRARAKPVYDEFYLLHLCRYIHANPVLHGLVQTLDEWPYSNYFEWIGKRNGRLQDRTFIQQHFPTPTDYRHFVENYLASRQAPRGFDEWLDMVDD